MKASLKRKATPAPVASPKAAPRPAKPPQGTWWWGAPDAVTQAPVAAPKPVVGPARAKPAPATKTNEASVLAELGHIASRSKGA